jgi:outer membrane protein TolC
MMQPRWNLGWAIVRRCLAVAGAAMVPACASVGTDDPARLPPPSILKFSTNPEILQAAASAQDSQDRVSGETSTTQATPLPTTPQTEPRDRPLPINLPTALTLASARPIDVMAAAERIRVAAAELERARVLWVPSLTIGMDYNRHGGSLENDNGVLSNASNNAILFGFGTGIGDAATLNINEAIFAPLVARQNIRAKQADLQAAQNNSLVAVTDAYFTVQQARGELAGAIETARRTEDLVLRTRKLAPGLVPDLEITRAEAELVRRQQLEELARERWRVTGAELIRLLRLDPSTRVNPVEPPNLRIDLIPPNQSIDELIAIGLTSRPELASQQAQVQATLTLLKQEKLRPLVPSLLLSGFSTPGPSILAAGLYTAGPAGTLNGAGFRTDIDVQLLWQFDNLGLGNRARIHQRQAENRLALVEFFRVQDRVAAEVAQAHARAQESALRLNLAEKGIRLAVESANKNLVAISQIRRVGEINQLVVRPLEVVASLQTLGLSYTDYYTAVADYNRAQFQLYRALGYPANYLAESGSPAACPPATPPVPSPGPAPSLGAASVAQPRPGQAPQMSPSPISVYPPGHPMRP